MNYKITKIDELSINGCNCFNCGKSHLFDGFLKCSKDAKSSDGSDHKIVDEYDIKECWVE